MKSNERTQTITRSEHNKENPYLLVNNQIFQSGLSCQTIGIFLLILKEQDFYKFQILHFSKKHNINRRSLFNSIEELISKGFCKKETINKRVVNYYFFEIPKLNPDQSLCNFTQTKEEKFEQNSEIVCADLHNVCADLHKLDESLCKIDPLINNISNNNLISILNNDLGKLEIENPNLTESDNTPIDLDLGYFENDGLENHPKKEKSNLNLMVKPENKSETNNEKMKIKREFTLKKKELIQNAIKIACEGFQIEFKEYTFEKWYNWKVGLDGVNKVLSFEALLGSFKTFSAKDKGETPDQSTKSTRAVQIEEKEGLRLLAEDRKRKEEYKDAVKKYIYDIDLKRWESEGVDKAATKLLQRIQFGLNQFDKYPFEDWKKVATNLKNNIINSTVQENLLKIK